jgi:hypothetical protein
MEKGAQRQNFLFIGQKQKEGCTIGISEKVKTTSIKQGQYRL